MIRLATLLTMLVALLAGAAFPLPAQPPGRPSLEALDLTAAQRRAIARIERETAPSIRRLEQALRAEAAAGRGRDAISAERRSRLRARLDSLRTARGEATRRMREVLTPVQRQRLDSLRGSGDRRWRGR